MKPNVLLTIPTSPASAYIHKQVLHACLKISNDGRCKTTIITPSRSPYENNLHHIVVYLLKGNWDYWINIDSDNPPTRNPVDLVFLDKDIIGLPTPVWHFLDNGKKGERPIYWNGYDYVPNKDAYKEHGAKEGLQKVAAIGTGCFVISRKVFENNEMQKGAFTRKLNNDGTVNKGNDMSFCERAVVQEFEIYCHYDYPCMHFSQLELNEITKAFRLLWESK